MMATFFETRLEQALDVYRLLDQAGNALLELRGAEIDAAIRAGFVDPSDCHYSMYVYARVRQRLAASLARAAAASRVTDAGRA